MKVHVWAGISKKGATPVCIFDAVESPDLNATENLWHELKEYIRHEVKPKTKADFVYGILAFWKTV